MATFSTPTDRDWFKGKQTSQGGPDHIKGRDRLIELFKQNGLVCTIGRKFWAKQEKGEVPYEPDIFVEGRGIKAVVEVDKKSHDTKRAVAKDHHRDRWFREEYEEHIPTVRYWGGWLVGKRKWTNRELMEFFWEKVNA